MSKSANIEFKTRVEKTPGKGGWHFVRIPDDVRAELREMSGKNGNVPVVVEIGKTSWSTTTMSMGSQQWFVAVKSEVRKAESVNVGDELIVKMSPDTSRLL